MKLGELQKLIENYVVSDASVFSSSRGDGNKLADDCLEGHFKPSGKLSVSQRLDIYRDIYQTRMYDALVEDFPGTAKYLGDQFDSIVSSYISVHPSRSFTLNHLGRYLPRFLSKKQDFANNLFVKELSDFEWKMCEVFHGFESEGCQQKELESLAETTWESAQFEVVDGVILKRTSFPLVSLERDLVADRNILIPEPGNWLVYISKVESQVQVGEHQGDELDFLEKLIAGVSLSSILDELPHEIEVQKNLIQCFEDWIRFKVIRLR